jgi:hypothetical protein
MILQLPIRSIILILKHTILLPYRKYATLSGIHFAVSRRNKMVRLCICILDPG